MIPFSETEIRNSNDNFDLIGFQSGDLKAAKWVYDRLAKQLLYFSKNIVGSHEDAEDVVANTFVKLLRVCGIMENYDHIKRWLYVCVRNASIDLLRSRARERELVGGITYLATHSEQTINLEQLKTELLASLSEAIEALPRQRRMILKMYFYEGLETNEIAERMGLNSQTVLNHKTRALHSLRKTVLVPEWLAPVIFGIAAKAAILLLFMQFSH